MARGKRGRFKEVTMVRWSRPTDGFDGFLIMKVGREFDVLVEDDGNWFREESFPTLEEAKEFLVERDAQASGDLKDGKK